MYSFDYARPATLDEAKSLMDEDVKALAGGQTYLPTLRQRLAMPEKLVDLNAIPELTGICEKDGGVSIGAMTRHAEVASSELVQSLVPGLAQLAGGIGDPGYRPAFQHRQPGELHGRAGAARLENQLAQHRIIEELPPEAEISLRRLRLRADLAVKIRLPVLEPGNVGLFVVRAEGATREQQHTQQRGPASHGCRPPRPSLRHRLRFAACPRRGA